MFIYQAGLINKLMIRITLHDYESKWSPVMACFHEDGQVFSFVEFRNGPAFSVSTYLGFAKAHRAVFN